MAYFNLSDYETVEERIEKFWEKFPEGAIRTELASPPTDFERCRYRAEVYAHYTNTHPIATGYAFEIAGSSPVNRTNHEENGETSAIGRALANAGFATKGQRPSREEMDKAQRGESQPGRPQPRDSAPAPARAEPVAQQEQAAAQVPGLITPPQERLVRSLMREKAVSDEAMHATLLVDFGGKDHLGQLTKREASAYIDRLQAMPLATEQGIKQEPQRGFEFNQSAVPDEPAWMRSEAGADRHTA